MISITQASSIVESLTFISPSTTPPGPPFHPIYIPYLVCFFLHPIRVRIENLLMGHDPALTDVIILRLISL